jgi:hypothetical protein
MYKYYVEDNAETGRNLLKMSAKVSTSQRHPISRASRMLETILLLNDKPVSL